MFLVRDQRNFIISSLDNSITLYVSVHEDPSEEIQNTEGIVLLVEDLQLLSSIFGRHGAFKFIGLYLHKFYKIQLFFVLISLFRFREI